MKINKILNEEFDPNQFIKQFEIAIRKLSIEQLRELSKTMKDAAQPRPTHRGPGARVTQSPQQK